MVEMEPIRMIGLAQMILMVTIKALLKDMRIKEPNMQPLKLPLETKASQNLVK